MKKNLLMALVVAGSVTAVGGLNVAPAFATKAEAAHADHKHAPGYECPKCHAKAEKAGECAKCHTKLVKAADKDHGHEAKEHHDDHHEGDQHEKGHAEDHHGGDHHEKDH